MPNGFVTVGVVCCVPWVPALLSTGTSAIELSNSGTLVPDVVSFAKTSVSGWDVVLVFGTRWNRFPPNPLVI